MTNKRNSNINTAKVLSQTRRRLGFTLRSPEQERNTSWPQRESPVETNGGSKERWKDGRMERDTHKLHLRTGSYNIHPKLEKASSQHKSNFTI